GPGQGLGEDEFPHGKLFTAGRKSRLRIHALELRIGKATGGGDAFTGGLGAGAGGVALRCTANGLDQRDGGQHRREVALAEVARRNEWREQTGDDGETVHGTVSGDSAGHTPQTPSPLGFFTPATVASVPAGAGVFGAVAAAADGGV